LHRKYFPWLARNESDRLARIHRSPFPAADGAALLLGNSLWIEPLVAYRNQLERSGEAPPPLWQFPWEPSAAWDARRWQTLPLEARVVRARAGSLAHRVERPSTAQILELPVPEFVSGLSALLDAGFASEDIGVVFDPIADAATLRTDLHLVELIVHWLRMLSHRDRVLSESLGNRFDVCGHRGACAQCRALWGIRPRLAAFVPPFHPGCRCFAQPSFAA
jgi:hypothetical protein